MLKGWKKWSDIIYGIKGDYTYFADYRLDMAYTIDIETKRKYKKLLSKFLQTEVEKKNRVIPYLKLIGYILVKWVLLVLIYPNAREQLMYILTEMLEQLKMMM